MRWTVHPLEMAGEVMGNMIFPAYLQQWQEQPQPRREEVFSGRPALVVSWGDRLYWIYEYSGVLLRQQTFASADFSGTPQQDIFLTSILYNPPAPGRPAGLYRPGPAAVRKDDQRHRLGDPRRLEGPGHVNQFLSDLANGPADNALYASATGLYGGSWADLESQNPDKAGDHAALLQVGRAPGGYYLCLKVRQLSLPEKLAGGRYRLWAQFSNAGGSQWMSDNNGQSGNDFEIVRNSIGQWRVMDPPPTGLGFRCVAYLSTAEIGRAGRRRHPACLVAGLHAAQPVTHPGRTPAHFRIRDRRREGDLPVGRLGPEKWAGPARYGGFRCVRQKWSIPTGWRATARSRVSG